MTIVIAQRRGDEVLFLSDTMVGEPQRRGPDVMPGRLKVVTIAPRLTVAFAGNADPANVALCDARRAFFREGLSPALQVLRDYSTDGHVDFIVCSHHPNTALCRIRNGALLEVNDICTLGYDEPFRPLIETARSSSEAASLAKSDLRVGFADKLLKDRGDLGNTVGGFAIAVLATPTGHSYLRQTGVSIFEFPQLKWGEETHQPIEQVYTGRGHFMYSVFPAAQIDVPVVGVLMLQARTGYIYSPLEHPNPSRVQLVGRDVLWEGREQEMYSVLAQALAARVDAVLKL